MGNINLRHSDANKLLKSLYRSKCTNSQESSAGYKMSCTYCCIWNLLHDLANSDWESILKASKCYRNILSCQSTHIISHIRNLLHKNSFYVCIRISSVKPESSQWNWEPWSVIPNTLNKFRTYKQQIRDLNSCPWRLGFPEGARGKKNRLSLKEKHGVTRVLCGLALTLKWTT